MPRKTAGTSPTAESTEYLPPRLSGTGRERMECFTASSRRKPLWESVIMKRWSRQLPGSFSWSQGRTRRYCAMVSMVPPDLLMTTTTVSSGGSFSKASASQSVWMLSAIQSQGPVQPGLSWAGAKARCRARGPRADPPMPRRSMCLKLRRKDSWRSSSAVSSSAKGRERKGRTGSSLRSFSTKGEASRICSCTSAQACAQSSLAFFMA